MAGGEPGARRALEILATEFERAMKLCGVRTVAEIGPELLASAVRGGEASAYVGRPAVKALT